MIKFCLVRSRFVLTGALPADLNQVEEVVGVMAQVGQRTVAGYVLPDGNWRVDFHSRKRVLMIGLHVQFADGSTRPLQRWIGINCGREPYRGPSEWEKYLAGFAFCELAEAPAQRMPPVEGAHGWSLQWIIPDFHAGAGGIMAIFQVAAELERRGHRNTFWIMGGSQHPEVKAYVARHFVALEAEFHALRPEEIDRVRGDVVMATNDRSAYFARAVRAVAAKVYFVQDYEPFFYPAGADFWLSRATYRFGFKALTAGPWLRVMLEREGCTGVRTFDFAYDRQAYFPRPAERVPGRKGRRRNIAFYARSATPRRAVPLGLRALTWLAERRGDFVVHLFGEAHEGPFSLPFPCVNHGVLSAVELGGLYRGCDVGLVFSATNHSIAPMEMMACGLPVVELEGEQNALVYPADAILLTSPEPRAIAAAVARVLDEDGLAERLRAGGYTYALARTWERSGEAVEQAVAEAFAQL